MTNLTTINANNIDKGTYNFFTETIDQLEDENITYGQAITEILLLYIEFATKNKDIMEETIELLNNKNHPINTNRPTTTITIKQIHPKTHKKFRKYLQKKYKAQNNKEHYNKELNTALILYTTIIQLPLRITNDAWKRAIKRKQIETNCQNGYEILKEEFTTLCQEYNITPEEADIYELF